MFEFSLSPSYSNYSNQTQLQKNQLPLSISPIIHFSNYFCALLCIPIGMSKKLSKKFQIVMLNVMIFIHFPFSSSFSSKYFLICGYLFLVFFEIKENDIINNWKTAEIYKTYTSHPETFFLFYSFVLHKNNISYQSPALKLGFSQDLINYFRLLL